MSDHRFVRLGLLAIGAVALLAPLGCGGSDEGPSSSVETLPQVKTDRPELAYFTTHGGGIYDLGIADDRGDHARVLTGESEPGTVVAQLFTGISWSPDGQRIAFAVWRRLASTS